MWRRHVDCSLASSPTVLTRALAQRARRAGPQSSIEWCRVLPACRDRRHASEDGSVAPRVRTRRPARPRRRRARPRWRDVDWLAQRVRVRQNYVRGKFGTPKTKRSTRSMPLPDRLAGELDLLSQCTRADDDLVFAHPETGKPIDRSRLLKRYKAALK